MSCPGMKTTARWNRPIVARAKSTTGLSLSTSPSSCRLNCKIATSRNGMSRSDVQCLQHKRRYEARCAVRRWDEQGRAVRENDYLQMFTKEYESLAHIQGAMS